MPSAQRQRIHHHARPAGRGPSFARGWRPLVLLPIVAALVACGQSDVPPPPVAPGGGMPAPQVGVVVAKPGEVGLRTELPGRLEASRVAQVRARAAGILVQRQFREGSDVKAGQLLFRIDPGPYEAALQSARANLARAEASLVQAKSLADRYQPLVAENAVSQQDYANAVSAQKMAEAEVAAAKATVQTATINLGYANVTAPISGRIGRALVTEGALVGQGEATPLAVIQQIDPLYVNFTQPASEALRLRRAMEAGQLKAAGSGAAEVSVLLEDGTEYQHKGKLLFADLTVDTSTGQVTLRAEVPNPQGELLPGLYVRVQMEQAMVNNAITVPQQAVTRTDAGDTLTVVDAEGKLSTRNVKVVAGKDNQWIVTEGLQEGEQVMVDGFQKLQMLPPGTPVKAVPWTPPNSAAPAAAAPAEGQPADAGRQQ
ncbi:MAG: efflux RND transporter periplasmic adaptor subunit [Hydrogenophaga sp.]|uniref:efflux RND transporter periplasmic adaptor subunit n=1 Tax=Hydrogenophaga sp. TaxID=1904254 RepID=UPI000ED261B5|nr:efflux RND transporter periplasmic adaptor subunit [Hydrogenophaga sp.]MDX9968189.1 efflux RND transporter periplasmic adaptor subunit [Hydrogenophaga sp.]HAJ13917.1 efflux transporter periplasmic adaptor subunit [Comamonadaceae bacterium]